MEINKENELIQEAFEIEAFEIGFCLDQKWGDYENPYENNDTTLAFDLFKKGWKAKQQVLPEGFVLMPIKPTLKMSDAYEENAVAPCSSLSVSGYKAMIEAQEQSHELD